MKKKKQNRPMQQKQQDKEQVTLKDFMNDQLLQKFKETKQQLLHIEEEKKEAEQKRLKEEARLREKNKSFEELLNDSDLKWNDFK
ncbi:MAG: YqkE family protein [Bacillaceae bacterium]